MARRLKTIAEWINRHLHGYHATISASYCNTDRKYGRLRFPGKGRHGNELVVHKNGVVIFEHNAAETYRRNQEVEAWLAREIDALQK